MQYEVPAGRFFKSQGSAHTLTAEFSIFYAWSLFFFFSFLFSCKTWSNPRGGFFHYIFVNGKNRNRKKDYFCLICPNRDRGEILLVVPADMQYCYILYYSTTRQQLPPWDTTEGLRSDTFFLLLTFLCFSLTPCLTWRPTAGAVAAQKSVLSAEETRQTLHQTLSGFLNADTQLSADNLPMIPIEECLNYHQPNPSETSL